MTDNKQQLDSVNSSWTIDQMNEDWATLTSLTQNNLSIELPLSLLPQSAQEGQILQMNLAHDPTATQEEADQLKQEISHLSADDDGGDFSL